MISALNPLDKGSTAKFQTRADAVFGNLGADEGNLPEASSAWQLKKEQVYRSGKEAEEASSEDEAAEPGQEPITGLLLLTPCMPQALSDCSACMHLSQTLTRLQGQH